MLWWRRLQIGAAISLAVRRAERVQTRRGVRHHFRREGSSPREADLTAARCSPAPTEETVEAFISSRSVDVEGLDKKGRSVLSWAVEYRHLEVVRTLLQASADPRSKAQKGRSPEGALRLYEEEHGQYSRRHWWRTKSKDRLKGGIAYV